MHAVMSFALLILGVAAGLLLATLIYPEAPP
jgi:hypothetical protein